MNQTFPLGLMWIENSAPRRIVRSALLTDALLVLAGSLCIALLAQFRVTLPFSPVPMTGQTLGVLWVGALLGSRRGLAATSAYLLEGAVGLPFFAGGSAGMAVLVGPTGGYLLGFLGAAFLMGFFCERGWDRSWKTVFPAFLMAHAVIFLTGMAWLKLFVGAKNVWVMGFLPFVPGELLKSGFVASVIRAAWSATSSRK